MFVNNAGKTVVPARATHFEATPSGVLNLYHVSKPDDGTCLWFDRETHTWQTTEISDRSMKTLIPV